MTRINCIPVEELHDKHLIAEYRELPRVFKLARPLPEGKAPSEYCMGEGHVLFFYDKLLYLYKRQRDLVAEMKKRGFKVSFSNSEQLLQVCPYSDLYNDWQPDAQAKAVNRERINQRLAEMKGKVNA